MVVTNLRNGDKIDQNAVTILSELYYLLSFGSWELSDLFKDHCV